MRPGLRFVHEGHQALMRQPAALHANLGTIRFKRPILHRDVRQFLADVLEYLRAALSGRQHDEHVSGCAPALLVNDLTKAHPAHGLNDGGGEMSALQ